MRSALSPSTSSSRAARVSAVTSGVPQARASNALLVTTRSTRSFDPKMPRAHPALHSSAGMRSRSTQPVRPDGSAGRPAATFDVCRNALVEQRIELARTDDPERNVGSEARGCEDRVEPVMRDQLAVVHAVERLGRRPARPEERLGRPEEAHRESLTRHAGELGEEVRMRLVLGNDEVRDSHRPRVHGLQHPRGKRARPPASAVDDERVVKGTRGGLKTQRSSGRHAASARHVEVSWVTDDHDVELDARARQERQLRAREPERRHRAQGELVLVLVPQGDVALHDLDTGVPQARDRLRVPWVVALVGPEVENPHASSAQDVFDQLVGPLTLVHPLLVL